MLRMFSLFTAAVLPASAAVPTPESHFGRPMGVDRVLLDWHQMVSYFYKLEKSSPGSIRIKELGKTLEWRPFIEAIISAGRPRPGFHAARPISTVNQHPLAGLSSAFLGPIARPPGPYGYDLHSALYGL